MRFLWSGSGVLDMFGVLITPASHGIPAAVSAGSPWAADNQAYTAKFSEKRFFEWLENLTPYKDNCLFISVPDKVSDSIETIRLFGVWSGKLSGWPLAFVAQDGQEKLDFPNPDLWNTLFIGGSTEWKESEAAVTCIKRAQAIGKRIHIGRINTRRRYVLFRSIAGSDFFTCDGTRQRFDGTELAKQLFRSYEGINVLQLF